MAVTTPRSRRRGRLIPTLIVVAALAIAGFVAVRVLWHDVQRQIGFDHCDVGSYQLDPDQASVAASMVAAVRRFTPALPERAAVLALAAALQESKLRNLAPGDGDRDSVGVLQQRPSQGWGGGHAAALTDVGEATKEFLDALIKVPHWRTLSLADAIQAVQISADGSAYAQHEVEAQQLADALQGIKPAGITCDFEAPTVVASTRKVADQVGYELGINTPQVVDARTVRVPGAHWQTAAWFIANANRLGI